ncbi:unnamed protein product [Alternaria alternata]
MIVLFKFKPTVSLAHKNTFVAQLKALKKLSCVLDNRLIVGGPSITEPIERSKGYEVTSEYVWPYKEDVTRFDFEVTEDDEYMCQFVTKGLMGEDSSSWSK